MADRLRFRFARVRLTGLMPAAGRLAAAATSQPNAGQQADDNKDDLESFHGMPPASFEALGIREASSHPKSLRGVDSPHYLYRHA